MFQLSKTIAMIYESAPVLSSKPLCSRYTYDILSCTVVDAETKWYVPLAPGSSHCVLQCHFLGGMVIVVEYAAIPMLSARFDVLLMSMLNS